MYPYDEHQEFNRYINLDTLEGRILYILVNSRSRHALDLWNMLQYNEANCLTHNADYFKQSSVKSEIPAGVSLSLLTSKSELNKMIPSVREKCEDLLEKAWQAEIKKRWDMVYTGADEASDKKVFLFPFVDDAWKERSARLDIYVDDILPKDQVVSTVLIGIDIIVHNKINNITNLSMEDNPAEVQVLYDKDGKPLEEDGEVVSIPITITKSRVTTMLKSVLAELNGAFVAGVGLMQANQTMSPKCGAKRMVWNNRDYIGHQVVFGSLMSGVSTVPGVGF